jgi:hypothetical protein
LSNETFFFSNICDGAHNTLLFQLMRKEFYWLMYTLSSMPLFRHTVESRCVGELCVAADCRHVGQKEFHVEMVNHFASFWEEEGGGFGREEGEGMKRGGYARAAAGKHSQVI